jgi:hypothetical protein
VGHTSAHPEFFVERAEWTRKSVKRIFALFEVLLSLFVLALSQKCHNFVGELEFGGLSPCSCQD